MDAGKNTINGVVNKADNTINGVVDKAETMALCLWQTKLLRRYKGGKESS